MASECEFTLGQRIECEGYLGTVCYIGEVPPTKGIWLGIEWDDSSRGKHNGFHEGRQYFTTKHPHNGSFLRPKKANKGIDFLTALADRYGKVDDVAAGIIEEEMFVRGKRNQQTRIEVVGAHTVNLKQSEFNRLFDVGLRGMLIGDVGSEGLIAKECPNIKQLNVSLNLLSSWKQIAAIASQLQRLQTLDVSSNVLQVPDDGHDAGENLDYYKKSFQVLRTLYLNKMSYNWSDVFRCGALLPNLKELHACVNDITAITNPLPNLQHLVMLNLDKNEINDWKNVLELGVLQNLETLILNDTGIKEMYFPDCSTNEKTQLFPSLQSLSINRNGISEYTSINELNKLQSLVDLKIQGNPLIKAEEEATTRTIIIAKIAKLRSLNRTIVEESERIGAEIDYLKIFGLKWRKSGGDQDPSKNDPSSEFLEAHPRYMEIVKKFGAPEDSELKEITSALKNNLLSITIDCPQIPDKKPVAKKLPRTMTVQKLRALLARLYKVNADGIKITYTSKENENLDYELDNDQREIGFFSIEDNDVIHVVI